MRVAVIVAVLMLCVGCGSKYIVPGLTLPQGASVITRIDATAATMGTAGLIPGTDQINFDRAVTVNFNCPGGWKSTYMHFEQQLTSRSYEVLVTQKDTDSTLPPLNAPGTDLFIWEAVGGMGSMARIFVSPDGVYWVYLLHQGGGAEDSAPTTEGEFMLVAAQTKPAAAPATEPPQ